MQGHFITFEGVEGSGKTSVIQALARHLQSKGIPYITTREPGGSTGAEEIRNIILKGKTNRWDSITELLLMFASRRDHYVRTIKPALEAGKFVICDRFADSSFAIQGYAHGIDIKHIEYLYKLCVGDFKPDTTIILDIKAQSGLSRTKSRISLDPEDRFEKFGVTFHNKVREGFLKIAENDPERCVIVDASHPLHIVQEKVIEIISNKFSFGEIESKRKFY